MGKNSRHPVDAAWVSFFRRPLVAESRVGSRPHYEYYSTTTSYTTTTYTCVWPPPPPAGLIKRKPGPKVRRSPCCRCDPREGGRPDSDLGRRGLLLRIDLRKMHVFSREVTTKGRCLSLSDLPTASTKNILFRLGILMHAEGKL